jgi:hypothetical protein
MSPEWLDVKGETLSNTLKQKDTNILLLTAWERKKHVCCSRQESRRSGEEGGGRKDSKGASECVECPMTPSPSLTITNTDIKCHKWWGYFGEEAGERFGPGPSLICRTVFMQLEQLQGLETPGAGRLWECGDTEPKG